MKDTQRSDIWNMTNHTPTKDQIRDIEYLRACFINLVEDVRRNCPAGRELSLAITNLEQSLMWAVAAIARDQPERPTS